METPAEWKAQNFPPATFPNCSSPYLTAPVRWKQRARVARNPVEQKISKCQILVRWLSYTECNFYSNNNKQQLVSMYRPNSSSDDEQCKSRQRTCSKWKIHDAYRTRTQSGKRQKIVTKRDGCICGQDWELQHVAPCSRSTGATPSLFSRCNRLEFFFAELIFYAVFRVLFESHSWFY